MTSRSMKAVFIICSLLLVGGAAQAKAPKHSSVKITGPASVKLGKNFTFTVSGFAAAPADFVSVREASQPCASTYSKEFSQSAATGQSHNEKSGKSFTFKVGFNATNKGTHHLCVYVLNFNSIKTYAHADKKWVNHS